ncbi:hypothetical protein CR513_12619, partial [Mucuna pruriens]
MTARTKIDVHAGTLLMEFGDTLVQFNIFEAMKHLTKDHSLFGMDLIDELVEEYFQSDNNSEEISNLAEDTKFIDCLGSLKEEVDYEEVWEVYNLSDSEDDIDPADLSQKAKLIKLLDQVCNYENPECPNKAEVQVTETKKPLTTQVETMFIVEYESAKRSQDQEGTEVISAKKTSVKADLHEHCKPRSSRPKKTKSKLKPCLSHPNKERTAFHLDLTLVRYKEPSPQEGVGHNSQRPRSCHHT